MNRDDASGATPRLRNDGGVHFVTQIPPAEFEGWDPDRSPSRFVSGVGHHLLEPYARLRDRGLPVSIGAVPPRGTRTLVVSMQDIAAWNGDRRRRASWVVDLGALRVPRVVVVLGDHPRADRMPRFVRAVVVPNPSGVVDGRTRWVPLPPQRAMVPRAAFRRGRVAVMALKTGTPNVPDDVRDPAFRVALAEAGVELRLDERSPQWPDFSDVDLVLCTRAVRPEWDVDSTFPRKPPTKLINAWVAGCIPLVYPEVGHLDLVNPGVDALVVHSPAEILAAVRRLRDDTTLVERLEHGVAARGSEFAMGPILDRWQHELWGGDHAITSRAAVGADAVALAAEAVGHRWRNLMSRTRHRLRALVPGEPLGRR